MFLILLADVRLCKESLNASKFGVYLIDGYNLNLVRINRESVNISSFYISEINDDMF